LQKPIDEYESGPRCSECNSRNVSLGEPQEEETEWDYPLKNGITPSKRRVTHEMERFFRGICDETELDYEEVKFVILEEIDAKSDLPTAEDLRWILEKGAFGVDNKPKIDAIVNRYDRECMENDEIKTCTHYGPVTIGERNWRDDGFFYTE
jgi:hypothetical protein